MDTPLSSPRHENGFTLVEILVALTIGLFLIAGMLQMYVSSKQSFRLSEGLSRMQESGRYAFALIAADMRMVDFWGCGNGGNINVLLNPGCSTPTADSTSALDGRDGAAGIPDAPDSIALRGAVGKGLNVTESGTATITVTQPPIETRDVLGDTSNATGDIALVADCRGGDLFQVTGYQPSPSSGTVIRFDADTASGAAPGPPGNAGNNLSTAYDATAAVYQWREIEYSVSPGPGGARGLRIRENNCANGRNREVVGGVENMQIAYGEDMDGDGTADRYVSRNRVADMDAVVSVRVNLLLASAQDNLVDQPQQIQFDDYDGEADDQFTAPDRRLYQVLTATFAIRNRSL